MRGMLIVLWMAALGAGASWARDPATTRAKSDELLATAVHDSLSNDPRVNAMQVQVSAREGVVQLDGAVTRQADRDAAEKITRQVAGVRDVKNHIIVDVNPAGPGASPIPERPRP